MPENKKFNIHVVIRDDGTDNMVSRLEEVVRNATIQEFGNLQTRWVMAWEEGNDG